MSLRRITQHRRNRFVLTPHIEDADAETQTVHIFTRRALILSVVFDTEGALGASLGIDLVDGGATGTGTTVIQASSDNLNGAEEKVLSTPHAMDDGDHLNITVDDITTARTSRLAITCLEY